MSLNIIHVDMDAFYAAVEKRDNPDLENKPVIVGGDPEGRGVVSTACYQAREYGVHSAMPAAKAQRLCPEAIFISPRMDRYEEVSDRIFDILEDFTPLVEKISVDEAFLDVSGTERLFGPSEDIGEEIQKRIKEKLELQASLGIAPNKFLAKLASDMDKPAGFTIITAEEIDEILEPLPIEKIWGVGEETKKSLHSRGIETIAELKGLSSEELESMFGKFGRKLYKLSRGIDPRSVESSDRPKSISQEQTFPEDLQDEEYLFSVLMKFSRKVAGRLRAREMKARTVNVKICYDTFKTITRQKTYVEAFHDTETTYYAARRLIEKNNLFSRPVRLLGVGVSSLISADQQQLSLFAENRETNRIAEAIDKVEDKFGESSVIRAREMLGEDYGDGE